MDYIIFVFGVTKQIKSFVFISVVFFIVQIIIRAVLCLFYFNEEYKLFIAKYVQIEEIINLSFTLFLFLKVVYIFLGQSKLIENIRSFDNMQWLKKFLWFGFTIIVLWIIAVVFNLNKVLNPYIPINYPLRLSSSLIVIWISYHGFFNYNILTERVQLRQDIKKFELTITPVFETIETKLDNDFLKIEAFIVTNKKYKIADYSLNNLCLDLNISEKKLATTIKKNTTYGFPDYLNRFRTNEAAKYLTSDDFKNYTIVAIGLECGFNSSSTFCRVFKAHYHIKPKEYKLQNKI